jgi:nicotinate-nucleotide adenylyltransferase
MRVGLLGGSFNPAHEGHLAISKSALVRLGLDQVWWLVSPQNPLKPARGMETLEKRLAKARSVTNHPRIRACALESLLGTRYTVDTLSALKLRFPKVAFVWLLGADNLIQLSKWKKWQQILNNVPVAVFSRPTYSLRAVAAKSALRFARYRIPESRAGGLAGLAPPAWVFIHGRLNPQSSTALRAVQRPK